ncbi:hypothetical protein FKM82_012629 [Ascaphus truei]
MHTINSASQAAIPNHKDNHHIDVIKKVRQSHPDLPLHKSAAVLNMFLRKGNLIQNVNLTERSDHSKVKCTFTCGPNTGGIYNQVLSLII